MSVVIHGNRKVDGKMDSYQIFMDKKQLTNKVQIEPDTIFTAYDVVQSNGQNLVIMAFLALDGQLRIDTAKSSINRDQNIELNLVSSWTSDQKIYGKKLVIKGN
jgi:hypothetical protein